MIKRRKTSRFRSFRRRRLSPFSKKRYDTVSAFQLNRCEPELLPFHECPAETTINPERIVLIDNSLVELGFSDSCTLVRLSGFIKFIPFYDFTADPASPADVFNQRLTSGYQFAGGLRRVNQATGDVPTDDPIANPLQEANDYVDIKWYKFWHKQHDTNDNLQFAQAFNPEGMFAGICSEVSKPNDTAPANTLSNGSGTITISAISTNCTEQVTSAATFGTTTQTARMAPPITCWMNMRRRIPLRRKEALVFDFNYLPAGSGLGPDVAFAFFGMVKAVIEI